MMLKEFFRFLPLLGWGLGGDDVGDMEDRGSRDQIAINTCLSAVQTYFPCDSTATLNLACLCEQYAWRVACYDNHASIPSSHHARADDEREMDAYCRAAGSFDTLRQNRVQRRQLDSIFASIGGDIISFFKPPTPDATSAPAAPSAPAATKPQASAAQPTRAPASTPTPTLVAPVASVKSSAAAVVVSSRPVPSTLATQVATYSSIQVSASPAHTETATASASPTAAPAASSGPSTGLIVGVVFGILILLAAIGILAMLVLRHRRNAASAAPDAAVAEDKKGITQASRSEASMETVRTEGQGLGEKGVHYGHDGQTGMASGNVTPGGMGSVAGTRHESWRTDAAVPHHFVAEIDGRELQAPMELEARAPLPDCLRAGRGGP